eukprot:scaffold241917_cov15-Tisochrysis_lutea.AAC.1
MDLCDLNCDIGASRYVRACCSSIWSEAPLKSNLARGCKPIFCCFKNTISQLAGPSSRYEEVAPQVAEHPVVLAVPDETLRAALFVEVVQGLRAEQK